MQKSIWQYELPRLWLWLGAGAFVGLVSGYFWFGVTLGLSVVIVRHLRNLSRFSNWVGDAKRHYPPDASGGWEELFVQMFKAEEQHRSRKRRLAKIVSEFRASTEALPDGGVVLDSHKQIVWFNDAARQLLGLQNKTDIGQPIQNLIRHPSFITYVSSGQYTQWCDISAPRNINQTLAIRLIPYGDEQHLLIARDVSELKRTEQMRRDFVANASHELRTPLTVLKGYLDLMQGDSKELGTWAQPVEEMHAQAQRMENVIADLLKLARLEAQAGRGAVESLNVAALLQPLISEAQGLSSKLHPQQTPHHIRLVCDNTVQYDGVRHELESALGNLIFNAVYYTPAGGEITVRVTPVTGALHIAVQDSGIGIDAKHLPRLTERFYRVDAARSRESGGTGLGLAIVKHALENHGGHLDVSSVLGQGSTFTAVLPFSN